MTDQGDRLFTILCVCTGDVCRSAVAERLLAARLGPEVAVTSAGVLGQPGRSIEPEMVAYLAALGVPDVDFEARRLIDEDVRRADLVLGMAREHRGAAVELAPAAVRRAFTLREFARLLSAIEPDELPDTTVSNRLQVAIPLAASKRRRVASPLDDDVIGANLPSPGEYAGTFLTIRTAVDAIADRVLPHPG